MMSLSAHFRSARGFSPRTTRYSGLIGKKGTMRKLIDNEEARRLTAASIKVFTDGGRTTDMFTRLTWTRNESTALLAHSHVVQQLDLKVCPIGVTSRQN